MPPPLKKVRLPFNPTDFGAFVGLEVPDPITFIIGERWLNSPELYPRQATLIKIIFLRTDMLTDYDREVIAEWEESFKMTGNNGIVPNIIERMDDLRSKGYKWFREVLLVMGRRAGKGHLAARAMAYVLWNYLATGNPQEFYGIDKNKRMTCLIYAGKKQQAMENLYKDVAEVITGAPCFAPYISRRMAESITVYAPNDKIRMAQAVRSGVRGANDMASFIIEPKEATLMSGRGSTSFMQGYDEFAHIVASGANRSGEEIYQAATPALDQFGKDAFIIEPSSPWAQTGQFYINWQHALELDPETKKPKYPSVMMVQLTSWEIYYDWEHTHEIELFPRDFEGDLGEYLEIPLPHLPYKKLAMQEYDESMQLLEQSNPDTFKVERRSIWQATLDAYLDPERIKEMWDRSLTNKPGPGTMNHFYKGHGDPSNTNANFGLAVAHTEDDPRGSGFKICVFDYIHHWDPANFEGHTIDYIEVIDELWGTIERFPIDDFSIDQFNSGPILSMLHRKAMQARHLYKQPVIYQKAETATTNWHDAENFKSALNQGWVKAPYYEQADLELRFLRQVPGRTVNRVDKQDSGPVTTKDVADCMIKCVNSLLGDQIEAMSEALGTNILTGGISGGITPFGNDFSSEDESVFAQFGAGQPRESPMSPFARRAMTQGGRTKRVIPNRYGVGRGRGF